MEIRIPGGSEVHTALFNAGFRRITATGDGYMVYVSSIADVQKAVNAALALGVISR